MKHEHGGDEQIRVGVLTVSDSRHSDPNNDDLSGQQAQREIVAGLAGAVIAQYAVVPDEQAQIEATLIRWADDLQLDLILTTGGTGLTARDVTPEATLAVGHRIVPGYGELMRVGTAQYTILSYLSRSVAVQRGGTLIVNLPGSPNAVRECIGAIMPLLPHSVKLIHNEVGQHTPTLELLISYFVRATSGSVAC